MVHDPTTAHAAAAATAAAGVDTTAAGPTIPAAATSMAAAARGVAAAAARDVAAAASVAAAAAGVAAAAGAVAAAAASVAAAAGHVHASGSTRAATCAAAATRATAPTTRAAEDRNALHCLPSPSAAAAHSALSCHLCTAARPPPRCGRARRRKWLRLPSFSVPAAPCVVRAVISLPSAALPLSTAAHLAAAAGVCLAVQQAGCCCLTRISI